jgi:hypothetical protein
MHLLSLDVRLADLNHWQAVVLGNHLLGACHRRVYVHCPLVGARPAHEILRLAEKKQVNGCPTKQQGQTWPSRSPGVTIAIILSVGWSRGG